jgi:hypothetical protein
MDVCVLRNDVTGLETLIDRVKKVKKLSISSINMPLFSGLVEGTGFGNTLFAREFFSLM